MPIFSYLTVRFRVLRSAATSVLPLRTCRRRRLSVSRLSCVRSRSMVTVLLERVESSVVLYREMLSSFHPLGLRIAGFPMRHGGGQYTENRSNRRCASHLQPPDHIKEFEFPDEARGYKPLADFQAEPARGLGLQYNAGISLHISEKLPDIFGETLENRRTFAQSDKDPFRFECMRITVNNHVTHLPELGHPQPDIVGYEKRKNIMLGCKERK